MTTKTSTKKPARTKVATKKKVSAAKAPTAKLTPESTIYVVKDSSTPTKELRAKVKRSVPAAGIKASDLMAKTDSTLKTLAAMVRRGFIEAR
jgi:hypothetical protein